MNIKYKQFFILGMIGTVMNLVSCTGSSPDEGQQKQPNIILIMADDLGYESVGCYGGTSYKTPNLDKLAQSGMKFNQAYAQPLCTNTRVKLMTGKYNFRNWNAFGILDPGQRTFGHLMQDAGYATCIMGKWQLQSYDPPNYPGSEYRRGTGMKVNEAGFDEYCLWHTGHTEDKGSRYADPTILQNGEFLKDTKGKYGPDIFVDFLNQYVGRQKEKPFFIYYPMALPHGPFSPTPNSKVWNDAERRFDEDTTYFRDMVEYTDKIVGDIIDNLEKQGLREETLVLFYSDNGTHQAIYSKMGNKTVQGGKGLTTTAGIKVPFIANWPGQIEKGTESGEYIDAIDFLPTILDAADKKVPDDFLTDGQSFLPVLKGQPSSRRDWVYMSYNPKPGWDKDQFAPSELVLNDQFKLYGDGSFFDVKKDILEKSAISSSDGKSTRIRFKSLLDSLKKYPAFGSVEQFDPAFSQSVSAHARIELIAEGFTWSEGPVWQPHGQKLLFSDVPENKIYQWNDLDGLSVYISKSGYDESQPKEGGIGSNGLALDPTGNLVICQQGNRQIGRLIDASNPAQPKFESIADNFNNKRFNSPNDLAYDSKGNLYFTDPSYGLGKQKSEQGFNGIYFKEKKGSVKLLSKSVRFPNGIAVSNDDKTLYVANSDPDYPTVYAFDIVGEGQVKNQRVFFDVTALYQASVSKQCPDGLKVDVKGNLFVAGPDGVLVISPQGKHLGTLRTDKRTSNCAFSDDGRFLFVTCDDYLLRVNLRPYSK